MRSTSPLRGRRTLLLGSLVLLPSLLSAAVQDPAGVPDDPPAPSEAASRIRERFVALCAPCHGVDGDGRGTTPLDRPARSFLDGGFSYGNTPEAIVRTLTYGIPGTPMPSFSAALTEAERLELARYVIALGPPGTVVDPKATELVLGEGAQVVRGYLPPIVDGAPERPRGLLLGLPSGTTFEFRADDVRLLGVRQGRFVDRKDWEGRGGQPLQPLGQVVEQFGDGDPPPPWRAGNPGEEAQPVHALLRTTFTDGPAAGVGYVVTDEREVPLANVVERFEALSTSLGAGYRRSFLVGPSAADRVLRFDGLGPVANAEVLAAFEHDLQPAADGHSSQVFARERWLVVRGPGGPVVLVQRSDEFLLRGGINPGQPMDVGFFYWPVDDRDARLDLYVITVSAWNDQVRDTLLQELPR